MLRFVLQPATPAAQSSSLQSLSLPSTNPVLLHHSDNAKLPLILFHDGSGQVSPYAKLTGHDRDVHGFFDPLFGNSDRPPSSVNEIASVNQLSLATHSPVILGGWSFGGVVAFEAVRILMERGFDVRGLVLIDSPSPIDHQPLPAEVIRKISKGGGKALEDEFVFNAGLLGKYKPRRFDRGLKTVMLKSKETFDSGGLCGVRYDWLERGERRVALVREWEGLVGKVEVFEIPGNHFEAFDAENVSFFSVRIGEGLAN